MAEKQPEELNIRDIKLLEYTTVGKGIVEFDEEDLDIFKKETWKLYVITVGERLLGCKKYKVYGECLIQFFPFGKENLLESAKKHNKTFMMKTLISPLFYIKYDSNLHVEFIHRSEEEIPKKVFFMILCR